VVGTIYCRAGGGAGHYTLGPYGGTTLGDDVTLNCGYGSSRPACPTAYGCNEKHVQALCCAPQPLCGNGNVDSAEEQCDDGNMDETDTCLNNCTLRQPPGCQ
jgi:cysteine-rich repeat protein